MVYIGFVGKMSDAIYPIMAHPGDVFGVPSIRENFNCLVVGASGSGKTAFMDAFIMFKRSKFLTALKKRSNDESKESVVQQTTANISNSDSAQLSQGSARLN